MLRGVIFVRFIRSMRLLLAASLSLFFAIEASALDFETAFQGLDGCFVLQELDSGKDVLRYGGKSCSSRLPACSTFKVALAAMAFDSGVLAGEADLLRWDGTRHEIEAWNRDHTAASWMRDSVVWYSQQLTPKLGRKRLAAYLKRFKYGNRDLSGGLTTAWLTVQGKPSLKLSVDEQAAFLRGLWRGKLGLAPAAVEKTKLLTKLETTPRGYTLYGKTGSGFFGKGKDLRLGWFVAVLDRGDEKFLSIVRFTDRAHDPAAPKLAGRQAREIMTGLLSEANRW